MKKIFIIIVCGLISPSVQAQVEKKSEAPLKKCVGTLASDGSVTYKEDCIAPTGKIVKKGIRPHVVTGGSVDTPQKAMELYNKTKDEATTIETKDHSAGH